MVQCEMCGTETSTPKTVKVEGAELDVCDQCAEFGTEVKTQESSTTSTKYSTSSRSGSSSSTSSSTGSSTSSSSRTSSSSGDSHQGSSEMFDDVDELAQDYDEQIRKGREDKGMSQSDLAKELNEKASLIRKLERGETLPSDKTQHKLERFLDVDLSGSADVEDSEWESDSSTGEITLGDKVERKD